MWKSEGHILWSLNYTEFMFRAHPETHEYLRGQREAIAAAGSVGTRVSRHPLGAQWTSGDWWIATRGQVMKQKVWRTDKFDMPNISKYVFTMLNNFEFYGRMFKIMETQTANSSHCLRMLNLKPGKAVELQAISRFVAMQYKHQIRGNVSISL